MNLETQKNTKRIENYQSKIASFLRAPLRRLTAVKDANVSWLLKFRIQVFLKSAVKLCK